MRASARLDQWRAAERRRCRSATAISLKAGIKLSCRACLAELLSADILDRLMYGRFQERRHLPSFTFLRTYHIGMFTT